MKFSVPTGWGELTQGQLHYCIMLYSLYDEQDDAIDHIKTAALFHFMGVTVDGEQQDGILCRHRATGENFLLDVEVLPWMLKSMEWLAHPEQMTDRIEVIHGYHAVDFMLKDLMFGEYLAVENFFQGWIGSRRFANIGKMIDILYQVPEGKAMPVHTKFDYTATILWWGAVKYLYGKMFPHFLKPSSDDSGDRASQREMMDAQIRLLTKGDVTKEDEILNHTSAIRALTELDALAKETEELEKIRQK